MAEPLKPAPQPAEAEKPTGFDRVAWCYDVLASLVFGPAQRRAQLAALAGLPDGAAPHVLILGGGTGWVLLEVLRRRPHATVLYLEASPKMLARARARLARECPQAAGQVEFRHGTEAALRPQEQFDAIVTFFVLDCIASPELPGALDALRRAQRSGAPWLVADFRPARRGWRRWLLAAMYWFFRLTTGLRANSLPDLQAELGRLGLRPQLSATFFARAMEGVVFSESRS
ncbi:class I SAM-dependent methyltransferase [Hymenobacter properus]|uniref:Class I SAM-dependent methyltransferase n=1 Tax=Hymenobacter properus TaxID=2791026 RepID=A0A931BBA0_9BACT|nr:class I SAM-dependent methyltransferase [Hymenobacter properus]MBF9140690.1 class I SAM-dependent methyltransferase [Hymenobacter properus]MBR7719498.1 class I SAM-dependent methyltransferase [Microvirga sp. SRT04]